MVKHHCHTGTNGKVLSTREILELPGQNLSMQQLSNFLSGRPHMFSREEDVMVRQVHGDASYPMAAWRAIIADNQEEEND